MDPNLFHLDWERTVEVLAAVVVLSILIERALAVLFEHRAFIDKAQGKGAKEIIAFVVAAAVCIYWDFDAISMIILRDTTSIPGEIVTAGIIAGGSKGSIKLFRDVLGFKSTAYAQSRPSGGAQPSAPTHPPGGGGPAGAPTPPPGPAPTT